MSAQKQTTATPFSVSHLVIVQLSNPPEAAKATVRPFRSLTVTRDSVGQPSRLPFSFAQYQTGKRDACPTIFLRSRKLGGQPVDEWDAMGHGMKVDRRSTD